LTNPHHNPVVNALFSRVSISSIVIFRIVFGIIMICLMYLYLFKGGLENRLLSANYFTYWPFDFIHPLSEGGMRVVLYTIAVSSFFVAIGFLYRLSMSLIFILFTYVFLNNRAGTMKRSSIRPLYAINMAIPSEPTML